MKLHPSSDDLLRGLLYAHWIRGEPSFNVQQYDKAGEAYQGGVDLFTRYRPSIKSRGEYTHHNYLQCCRGLLQIAKEKKDTERAIALATKLIVPIKLDTFTEGDHKQSLIGEWTTLSELYADTGNVEEAIRLRVLAVDEAKKILGGDLKSNWYLSQYVWGSHRHLVPLYRKSGDQRHEFESLRGFLKDEEAYVREKDHSALLTETADFTPANLNRLRDAFTTFSSGGGMKRFTIPTDFNGVKYPCHVYVADSWQFLEDQFTWLEKVRGGKVPKEVVDSFRRLYKIAKDNNVSYQDLCVYALGSASEPDKIDKGNPIAWAGVKKESTTILQELATVKKEIQAGKGGSIARKRLALKYARLAEDEIATSNSFRAGYFLADSRGYLDLDSFGRLRDPKDRDVYAYFQYVEGVLLACGSEPAKGYSKVLESFQTEPEGVAAEFTIPPGNREFALGWVCVKLQRPVEAAVWYRKAMERGHRYAAGRLYLVHQDHPQSSQVLPDDLRKLLLRAKTAATKDEPAPAAFARLVAEARAKDSPVKPDKPDGTSGAKGDAEKERKAVAVLRAWKATITVDDAAPNKPVVGLRLNNPTKPLDALDQVAVLMAFEEALPHLKNLRSLDLSRMPVTDKELKEYAPHLKGLRSLSLERTDVTDKGLKELERLTALESVKLRGTKVTDAGVKQLKTALPKVSVER